MLNLYRRHLKTCPHRAKGSGWQRCACPVWADGFIAGKRVRVSLRTRDWSRAETRRLQLEAAPDLACASTVQDAATRFLADCESRHLRQGTIRGYRSVLLNLADAIPLLGQCTTDRLARFRETRRTPDGELINPRTSRKELLCLRTFFAFCVGRGWLSANPASAIKTPLVRDGATAPLDRDEIEKILDACDRLDCGRHTVDRLRRIKARALCLTLLYSGLRISDACNLKRQAVNAQTGYLMLRRTIKTGEPIQVKLPGDCIAALDAIADKTDTFFFRSDRCGVTAATGACRDLLRAVGDLAGVHLHPHRFRDSFAVDLLTSGADIRTVQMLLGHRSVVTTERHYAHWIREHQLLLDAATASLPRYGKPVSAPVLLHRRKNG